MQLIRTAPGAGVGTHTHRGEELTLVLTGGFTDATGSYRRGDLQTTTPEIVHRPVTDDDGTCITLAMTDAPLKFMSPVVGRGGQAVRVLNGGLTDAAGRSGRPAARASSLPFYTHR